MCVLGEDNKYLNNIFESFLKFLLESGGLWWFCRIRETWKERTCTGVKNEKFDFFPFKCFKTFLFLKRLLLFVKFIQVFLDEQKCFCYFWCIFSCKNWTLVIIVFIRLILRWLNSTRKTFKMLVLPNLTLFPLKHHHKELTVYLTSQDVSSVLNLYHVKITVST